MTAADLLAAYPNVPRAVAWVEAIVCGNTPDDPESAWDVMMAAGASPQEVLEAIVIAAEDVATDPLSVAPYRRAAEAAVCEMGHRDFLTYIRGKMGAL